MSTNEAAWHELGDLLVTRRVQLDPRYANRRTFVAETHSGKEDSWYRLITSIENGSRPNYSRETLAAMEVAYQLKPGAIKRAIAGHPLEPAPPLVDARFSPATARRAVDDLRTYAEASGKKVVDVLIDEGLVDVEELVIPDSLPPDPQIAQINASDMSEEMKAKIIQMYLKDRASEFEAARLEKKKLDG